VVTERTGRSVTSAPGVLMRASVSVSAVTAGMRESFIDGQLISCVHNYIGQRRSIRKILLTNWFASTPSDVTKFWRLGSVSSVDNRSFY